MSAKVTGKAVSQVQNQLPEFINSEFPLYKKFMEHYYEFMETLCVYFSGFAVDQLPAIKLEDSIDGFLLLDSTDGTADAGDNILNEVEAPTAFTVGETVTGETSGATATVKATGAFTAVNKVFLEPTNDINFTVGEVIVGSVSTAEGTITKLNRKPLNATKTFSDLINSDETSEGLLKSFKKELYPNIRDNATADLKYFIKHLKEFYRSKGSEKSFRTLFRLLWGQEQLEFYYPKVDLLKVSDGNWQQDTVLQLDYDTTYNDFNGLTITGVTSGSTAFVSNITTRKVGSITIMELVLTNEDGTFTIGETISATLVSGSTLTAIVTGQMVGVEITDGGTGYDVGDSISIESDTVRLSLETVTIAGVGIDGQLLQEDGTPPTKTSYFSETSAEGNILQEDLPEFIGYGATANVSSTSADQVTIMNITEGGSGFQPEDTFTFDNTGTNVVVTAEAVVKTISNPYDQTVITTNLYEAIQTSTFNVVGATSALPFSVAAVEGYLIGNNETYASATKTGAVVSMSSQELRVYDDSHEEFRIQLEESIGGYLLIDATDDAGSENAGDNILSEETAPLAFADGDTLYLFDSSQVAISGATSVEIDDDSITNPSSDILVNAANYGTNFVTLTGTYSRTGTTVTATVTDHNLTQFFTINNAFSSDPAADYILTDNATWPSVSKKFTVVHYEPTSKRVFGHATLGTFANTNTVYLVNPNGTGQISLETALDGTLLQEDGTPDTDAAYIGSTSTEGNINHEEINVDVDGGTALSSVLSSQNPTIDFTSGTVSGTGDDLASFIPTSVANSSVFTFTTSGTGSTSGNISLISNANNVFQSAMTTEDQTFGAINSIAITSHGSGYEAIPTAAASNDYYASRYEVDATNGGFLGRNATISIGALGGAVTGVTITDSGFGYKTDPTIIVPVNSTPATIVPTMAVAKTKDGVHVGESGFPSSGKKLQDNDYYQDFSYVLQTTDSIDVWKQDVLKLLHPAGMKLFGEVAIATLLNSQMFDRGLNNINSLNEAGTARYRELGMRFFTVVLDDLKTQVETVLNQEVEFKVSPTRIKALMGNPTIRLEDTLEGWLLEEDGVPTTSTDPVYYGETSNIGHMRIEAEPISSLIEYLTMLLASNGSPAEFFSLMSAKTVSNVSYENNIFLESSSGGEDNVLLQEDGIPASSGAYVGTESTEGYVFSEIVRTKLTTSEPHYFHEGDEIWLDEFEGTGLEGINGNRFKASDVEFEGNLLLEDSIDGTLNNSLLQEDGIPVGNASYFGTQSLYGFLKNELGLTFTLSDPKTTYASNVQEGLHDDFDIGADDFRMQLEDHSGFSGYLLIDSTGSGADAGSNILSEESTGSVTITTNGKIFRTGKEMTTGIPISLLAKEYTGEYSGQVIHNFEHLCSSDFSTLTDGINWETRARHLSIESMILLDGTDGSSTNAGDEILLEDGVPASSGTYSGTTSAIGKILANEGVVDIAQHEGEISITEPQHRTVTATYIIDHDFNNVVLEDDTGGKISTEESIIQNGVIQFDRPFDYKGQPYENNHGFLYYNHKIDQRVSV